MKSPMKPAAQRLLSLFALLSLAATGCGIQVDAGPDVNTNICTSDSDCGSEAACVSTQTGEARCVVTTADLGKVILEVRPIGSNASYVFLDALDVVTDGGKPRLGSHDIELPDSVAVTGTVPAPEGLSQGCLGPDGSLPVDVTLIRQVEFGAFASRYEFPSPPSLDEGLAEASFSGAVPPGKYDLYMSPHALAGCADVLPAPDLVMGLVIEAGKPFDLVADDMSAESELSGTLVVPPNVGESLNNWVLEVLDPTYGYVISNQLALAAPPSGNTIAIEGFFYHPIDGALLRLRDLNGDLAVHWTLDGLLLNADGIIDLDLNNLVADTHTYSASVIDSAGTAVQSAGVVIQSLKLTGSVVQNADYRVETRTDADGNIAVSLVEGTYSVTIIPDLPGEASYFGEWIVVAPPPGDPVPEGKAFKLVVQPTLSGSVSDPFGVAVAGASVNVGPSQTMASTYFVRAFGDPEPLNRQFAGVTLLDGSFDLSVDPGEVDIAVQMPAESGYAWSVLPSFKVDAAELKPQLDVGEVQLRFPAIVQGYVRDEGAGLAYAQVRAWKRVESGALVQIGSAISDAEGGYVLPLPSGVTIDETAAKSDDGQ